MEAEGAAMNEQTGDPVPFGPMQIRAVMARRGLAPMQLSSWWDADSEQERYPLTEPDTQAEARGFFGWLWTYCLQAEASKNASPPTDNGGDIHPTDHDVR